MIFWKDFVFDKFLGPTLAVPDSETDFRKEGQGSTGAQEVALERRKSGSSKEDSIQETERVQRPARMAGQNISENFVPNGMEAKRCNPAIKRKERGNG